MVQPWCMNQHLCRYPTILSLFANISRSIVPCLSFKEQCFLLSSLFPVSSTYSFVLLYATFEEKVIKAIYCFYNTLNSTS